MENFKLTRFILLDLLLFSIGLGLLVPNITNCSDIELIHLAAKLPQVLLSDKAHSTVKRYFSSFKRWENWARSKSITVLPAPKDYFALFLVHLIESVNSLSAFKAVICGVSWAHAKFGLDSPSSSPIVKQIIQAAHRQIGKATINRKLPLEKCHLKLLHDKFAQASLDQIQIVTLITLGFVAFLRWDDLSRLRCYDIIFIMTIWPFFLKKGKMTSLGKVPGFWWLLQVPGIVLSFCLKDSFPEEYILMTLICFIKYRIPSRATD